MKKRDAFTGDNEPNGVLSIVLAPLLATLAIGAAVTFFDTRAGYATEVEASAMIPPPEELSAGEYEALRDLVPYDRPLAPLILAAMRDGILDRKEAEDIAGEVSSVRTMLEVKEAREDLLLTARAYSPERVD